MVKQGTEKHAPAEKPVSLEGLTVDRMQVTTQDDKERTYFIDLETGRIVRLDLYADAWAKPVSLYFSDWRNAGGLQRPYTVRIFDAEKETLMQTIRYEVIKE